MPNNWIDGLMAWPPVLGWHRPRSFLLSVRFQLPSRAPPALLVAAGGALFSASCVTTSPPPHLHGRWRLLISSGCPGGAISIGWAGQGLTTFSLLFPC